MAVLNPACSTTILTAYASGMRSFLDKAGFIKHAYGIGGGQIVSDVGSQTVTQGIRLPVSTAEQMLKAVGSRVTGDLSELPAVFAFGGRKQASQIGKRTLTHVGTGEKRPNAPLKFGPIHAMPSLHITFVEHVRFARM